MDNTLAIIGSGMAGLAMARIARDAGHSVTLFESGDARGMDAHSLRWDGGLIDVPLRVMNPRAWQHVIALAAHHGVSTYPVDTWVTCSDLDGKTWLRTGRMPLTGWPSVAHLRYVTLKNTRLGFGLLKLQRDLGTTVDDGQTLADWLETHPQDPFFWRGLVLPLLTTICTCRESHLLAWPAASLLPLLSTIVHGERLRRLTGGTPALAAALSRDITFIGGSPVTQVRQLAAGVEVHNGRGEGGLFARAVIATPPTRLDFLNEDQFAEEKRALNAIRFDHGELWVHRDRRFLPKRRSDWTALHYQLGTDLKDAMFSVWVNAVEPSLTDRDPILQTWNPLFEPDPSTVLSRTPLLRAVVHAGTREALEHLDRLHADPARRVFFAGAWAHAGVPLLESAVLSAVAIARRLSMPLPWLPA